MFRRFSMFVLLLAALIAVEPLLHQHPLEQNSIPASACAVCATGVGQLPVIVPAVAAPQIVVYTLISASVPLRTINATPSLPSRAPPAA
jgi:hypothetical protein